MQANTRGVSSPAAELHPRSPRFHQRRVANSTVKDDYKGFLPDNRSSSPSREALDDLDKQKLWHDYISCRKPVVIDGLVRDKNWQGERWKDLSYLRDTAGSTLVKIEPVDEFKDQFGTGSKRKTVTLSKFLDMLDDPAQAGKWYMTTQYEEDDGDEDDDIVSEDESEPMDVDVTLPPPTNSMSHLFPLPGPEIMGNLVLQQCNLWMGNGVSGKSSGLHHDFHDNLYMLLSGRKRFLIWPPLAHRWLEPVGKIRTVHNNGLIEYEAPGQEPLQADGLTRKESLGWLFRARLRALLEADEKAARLTGEESVIKTMRKGKGKQTAEQEKALLMLKEAEFELLSAQVEIEDGDSDAISSITSPYSTVNSDSDLFAWDSGDGGDDDDGEEEDDEEEDEEESDKGDEDDEDDFDIEEKTTDKSTKGSLIMEIPSTNRSKNVSKSFRKRSQEESESETPSDEMIVEEDGAQKGKAKRQRRNSDKLVIPRAGLPGGLRGSLQDLEGDLDRESDEYADEDEEIGDLYYAPVEGEVDENEEEEMLMTLEMRNTMIARMRAATEGRIATEEKPFTDSAEDEEEGDTEHVFARRIGERGSEADSDNDSWPAVDDEAFQDGEAALEELARLQEEKEGSSNIMGVVGLEENDDPKSFSRISPKAMQWYFDRPFDPATKQPPQLPVRSNQKVNYLPREGCPTPIEIHLEAGQMLYLPASWYHEVTSYSDSKEASGGVHMALNYWFHPPTAIRRHTQAPVLSRGGSTTEQNTRDWSSPYLDVEVWDEIRRSVNRKVDAIRQKATKQAAAIADT
ncbi:hypothetical protein CBS101457_003976 [Exobasidium rhododendri]|nr:hypothetical protein CBS101457_003976 [Exobasidium rhododendri]